MNRPKTLPEVDANGPVEELDAVVARRLVPYAEHRAVRTFGPAGDLADQEPLYAAAAATLVTAVVLQDGKTWRAGTRILASHLLATALRGIVKASVDRTRPDAAAKRGEYVLAKGKRRDSDFNSFPSGHAAGAMAAAMAVGRAYPGGRTPALGLATLAGVAQVIRSRHFVSDVIAGAAIGLVAEAVVNEVIRRAERL